MTCKRSVAIVTLLLLPAVSNVSFANDSGGGGGGWWEKMSGPGPWLGVWGSYSRCLQNWDRAAVSPSDPGPTQPSEPDATEAASLPDDCEIDDRVLWLNLVGSIMRTGDSQRPELTHGVISAYSFEPSVDYRLHNIGGRVPLLVGAGVGAHFFRGENDVSFERASFEARLSVVFPRLFDSRWYLQLRYSPKYFRTGFTAADFGDRNGTYDSDGGEWINTATVFFGYDF